MVRWGYTNDEAIIVAYNGAANYAAPSSHYGTSEIDRIEWRLVRDFAELLGMRFEEWSRLVNAPTN